MISICLLWFLCVYYDFYVFTMISICLLWSLWVYYDLYVFTMISMSLLWSLCVYYYLYDPLSRWGELTFSQFCQVVKLKVWFLTFCPKTIWPTDILPTQCLVETTIAMSFGRLTFNRLNVWLKKLYHGIWPTHILLTQSLAVIWLTDILQTQCLVDKTTDILMTRSFVESTIDMSFWQQIFYWLNVWFKQQWHCHLVNRHFTDSMFGLSNNDSVIWSTNIFPTQCLVEKTMAKAFDQQTFYQLNMWFEQL